MGQVNACWSQFGAAIGKVLLANKEFEFHCRLENWLNLKQCTYVNKYILNKAESMKRICLHF